MAVFDKLAEKYDEGHVSAVKASGFMPDYFHEYKLKEISAYLKLIGWTEKKLNILNFGCGTGNSEKYIKQYIPNSSICSTDVSEECIRVAIRDNQGLRDVKFNHYDGCNIPFENDFDLILVFNVFHHIPRKSQRDTLQAIFGKLKNNGLLFMFELNPLNPLTLWVAINNDYKFDKNSKLLSPSYTYKILKISGLKIHKIKYTIFFPKFLSLLLPLEKYLSWFPMGAHYYYVAGK